MTKEELEALVENVEAAALLEAVEQIDALRSDLAAGETSPRAEIHSKLMTLRDLAVDVVNHGMAGQATAFFELANELDDQVFEMLDTLERIQDTLRNLTILYRDNPSDEDSEEQD
jgi:hypothetical protein